MNPDMEVGDWFSASVVSFDNDTRSLHPDQHTVFGLLALRTDVHRPGVHLTGLASPPIALLARQDDEAGGEHANRSDCRQPFRWVRLSHARCLRPINLSRSWKVRAAI